ncbi:hypothetical protein [Kineococcus sp. SYSU DK004]|uniref:hypothetical protein n=1 Tax=Kineococcus sp. SYSU DK004 TaxID=3383125 RepID=UPI003D7DC5F0
MDERHDGRHDERGGPDAWQEWSEWQRDAAGRWSQEPAPQGPAARATAAVEEPEVPDAAPERRPWTVDVPGVVGATVLLALAAVVGAREVAGVTWDWRWSATGVLLVAGLAVVLASVAAALAGAVRGQRRCGQRR